MDEFWSDDEFGGEVDADHYDGVEHDSVGTVDVQILLSWFFETADPSEVPFDVAREAA